jgi:hypothetical protein
VQALIVGPFLWFIGKAIYSTLSRDILVIKNKITGIILDLRDIKMNYPEVQDWHIQQAEVDLTDAATLLDKFITIKIKE